MDPLVGAVCNPQEIWDLVDEMLVAEAQWLPQYKDAIARAKARVESGSFPKREPREGAARLKTKTVEEMARDREKATRNAAAADKAMERPAAEDSGN